MTRDEDADDLLDAVYAFERFTAAIDRFVGWKGNTENNPEGVKEILQPFEHHTALCWYWGADCMEIMNTFDVQVGLVRYITNVSCIT